MKCALTFPLLAPRPGFLAPFRVRVIGIRALAASAFAKLDRVPRAVEWLRSVEKRTGFRIHHALNGGERGLWIDKRILFVDGYTDDTSPPTVYEFEGDFWHGNPDVYPFFDVHPLKKEFYGVLYLKTKLKHARIRGAGYDLVVRWECEDTGRPPPSLDIPEEQIRDLLSLHGKRARGRTNKSLGQ